MAAIDGLHEAAGDRHGRGPGVKSTEARSLVLDLLDAPIPARREVMQALAPAEWRFLLQEAQRETGSLYGLWVDDPVGFVEDVLGETVWGKQAEIMRAVPLHKRVAVPAGFGVGKCVHYADMIPLADGRMAEAGDLVESDFEVLAWQEDGTQVRRTARAAWNAVEPVLRLTTVSGRQAVRNGHHPFWAATPVAYARNGRDPYNYEKGGTLRRIPEVDGWKALSDLRPGDLVLVPERHCAEGSVRVPREHALFLGYMLGDGGTTDCSQLSFTQMDGPALDEFREVAASVGCELIPTSRPYNYRLRNLVQTQRANPRSPTGVARWNPAADLVREWGLEGKSARTKCFPAWAWTLPNDQLALVLGRLFACDGSVYCKEQAGNRLLARVDITLASERMIRDIEAAMLRLGIWGNVRHKCVKYNGGHNDAWEWSCRDREALARLAQTLDIPGKNHKLEAMVAALAAAPTARQRSWPRRNAPAGYRWDEVKSIERLATPEPTVAIEVDEDHTFVTSFVEHNTHLAGRQVVWYVSVHPPGTALCVTTATRFRQVRYQLWPHIRTAVAKGNLPGVCDTTQYKVPDAYGNDVVAAYGFSAPDNDEAAMQGVHAAKLMLVVDEAGGIGQLIGRGTNNLLTGDARMLAIGNPAMNDPGSWFENLCAEGESGDEPTTTTIRIAAIDSPAITGEPTPICRACDPNLDGHTIAGGTPSHLPDRDWLSRTLREYGAQVDSDFELDELIRTRRDPGVHPYVTAKVFAQFPKDGGNKIMPASWVEAAVNVDDPQGPGWSRLCDLGLLGENETFTVQQGSWIRLGVDVAADGGDEFAIYRMIGDVGHKVHVAAGSANADATTVAERVLQEIDRAQRLAQRLNSPAPVRVKIDANGLGWGAVGMLERWAQTGRHSAQIVGVMVSEKPEREDAAAVMRPYRKRDEMWLTGRWMLQPDPSTGFGRIRLRIDKEAQVQMTLPNLEWNAGGYTVCESKRSLKARGVSSPDRCEALLLAAYEPHPVMTRKRRGLLAGGTR